VEKNSDINSFGNLNAFELFGRMCVLLDSAPMYRDQCIRNLGYRFIPAVQHGRVRYYFRGDSLTGFVTWAYLTHEEADTGEYDGDEVFARKSGDRLWVMDMVAQDSVLYICRDLYKYFGAVTNHDFCYWRRGDRVGWIKKRLAHG